MVTESPSIRAVDAHKTSHLLLDAAVLLMASGAHTERVNRNLMRLALALDCKIEIFFSLSGITLTVHNKSCEPITAFRKIPNYGVQLSVVSAISRLSWKAMEQRLTFDEIEQEISRIRKLPHYPKQLVIVMLAVAGMAFCRTSGGDYFSMLLTGLATATGFFSRNVLLQKKYTLPVCIAAASFVASGISGLGYTIPLVQHPEVAVATSVLFLIPGIPMINSVVDLVHGHIITGQGRAMQATVISMAIAMGITLSSALLGVVLP